jgi:spore coat-associated protein N
MPSTRGASAALTRRSRRHRRVARARRAAVGASLVAVGIALAMPGAFGAFVVQRSTNPEFDVTGTLELALGSVNQLNLGATNLRPGSTLSRAVDVTNQPSLDFGSLTVSTVATTSSPLDTDAPTGLQLTIETCSAPWTVSGTSPNFAYACPGSRLTTVASRPIVGDNIDLAGAELTAGLTNHYLVTVALPMASPSSAQGKASTIRFTFGGVARAGQAE